MKNLPTIIYWMARIIASFVLLQTLYFKFTAAKESVYIFQTVGLEPVGRVSVGITELLASVLLLITSTAWVGALIGFVLMIGAIASHLFVLGIEINGDKGQLFIYAIIVFACCLYILVINKQKVVESLARIVRN